MKENEKPRVPTEKKSETVTPYKADVKWGTTSILKKEEEAKAGDMVEQAFNAAVVATVANNEKVQSEIVEGAEQVISNKTKAIKAQAEMEAKEAHFNNKKGACECFGFNETTTEKWAVNLMAIWHNIATAVWIIIGMFTFAPIIFFAKKVSVIIKRVWLAVLLGIFIYAAVVTSPWWLQIIAEFRGVVQ